MFETYDKIYKFLEEKRDPRTENWFLGNTSPIPCLSIILSYILLIKIFLPRYMKNRPPFKLTNVIFYYNVFQVVLSIIMVYMSYNSGYYRRFSIWTCRELDRSTTDPDAIMAARSLYLYYLAKFTEFLDTIFFVLRKKDNQVSFLHMFHHASMPFNSWIAVVFIPGGGATILVTINSSIHVVMYLYYLLSGLGPQWQKYLWWKKYLTGIQITQFIFGLLHIMVNIPTLRTCPEMMNFWPLIIYGVFYVCIILFLFSKFYVQTYNTSNSKNMSLGKNKPGYNNNILHNKIK